MAFPAGTTFKQTLRSQRQALFKAGNNYIQVYNATLAFKLSPPVLGPYQPTESDVTHASQL
jgi:hypothetical protein